MSKGNILLFADSSQETSSFLTTILKGSGSYGPLLSSFLEKTLLALQDERKQLPSTQRGQIPNFRSLEDLKDAKLGGGGHHPALHLSELVLVQLAYFINSHERAPRETYPTNTDTICLGVCFGEIAAAAVALSKCLNDLIPLAVDAVRLAFRGGLLAATVRDDIEDRRANSGSWALSVPRDTGLHSSDRLEALHRELGIPSHRHVWPSAFGNSTVTLAGPPSSLDLITEHLISQTDMTKVSALRRLPIYAPYHASHLFPTEQLTAIMDQSPSLDYLLSKVSQRKVLIGGSCTYPNDEASHIMKDVLREIFTKPIAWDTARMSCKVILDEDLSKSWCIRTFGPDLQGRSLASGLQSMGDYKLSFDIDFSKISEEAAGSSSTPIAIIGMSGRFPSAKNTDEFWDLLARGDDCVQEVPDDRFDKSAHFKNKIFGCFIDKPGVFDPRFFRMSPREAVNTDPAHRLGLSTVHEALGQAGVVPNSTDSTDSSRIGTFWGSATEEYKEEYMSQHVDPYYIPGSSRAFGPGRVNFIYGFDGPAVSFDTACSSSMIALNHACNSVWNEDCGTAIVVGTNILTAPYSYKGLDLGHFLSKTGGCKSFDEHADGYCRGEAVATIIIKKLPDAVSDNDNVLGVIRAISTNHSSSSDSITRPHGPTQEKLFTRLLRQSNLKPTDIGYVEMHGTGTQAGDTVEMSSVSNVLAPVPRTEGNPLYIGAVKANVGHGEGASGITSLVKALLMLREKHIPPHVGIKSGVQRKVPDLSEKNVRIASTLTPWAASTESHHSLRRVLISNFSAAGGNTSMIVEEAGPWLYKEADNKRSHQVISISGKSEAALRANMTQLLEWSKKQETLNLSDLAYTTTVRRSHYEFRHGITASTVQSLQEQLSSKATTLSNKDFIHADAKVVFTGYTNMQSHALGELFKSSRFFQSEISRMDQSIQRLGYRTIIPFFNTSGGDEDELTFVQKQLGFVAAQIGMYHTVLSWGIRPSVVTGHSLGEYVALCASGMISSDDLFYIVGLRAEALEASCELGTHGMLAVRASVADAKRHLGPDFDTIEISCVNGPSDTVLSGVVSSLDRVEKLLSGKKVQCSRVNTPLAFHSSQMDAVVEKLVSGQRSVKFNNARVPVLSATENNLISSSKQIGPDYFKRHTRGTVDFLSAFKKDAQENPNSMDSIWLEIGPHPIASPMIKSILGSQTRTVPFLRKDESVWATAPKMLGTLYNAGLDIEWKEFHREFTHQRVLDIPSHVLTEQHYWLPPKPAAVERVEKKEITSPSLVEQLELKLDSKSVQKLLSRSVQDGFLMLSFETDLMEPHLYEVMQGHKMNDSYLCPASLYTDIALVIGKYLSEKEYKVDANFRACVAELDIFKPIIAPHDAAGASLPMRIVAHTDLHDKHTKLRFETKGPSSETHVHAQCQVHFEKKQDWVSEWAKEDEIISRDVGNLEAKLFRGLSQKLLSGLVYRLFDSVVVYGDKFRSMKEVLVDDTQLQGLATIDLYQGKDCEGYACCPYWMDGLAHLAGFLINGLRKSDKAVYISPGWTNFRLAEHIDPSAHYKSYVKLQDHGSTVTAECYILLGERIVGKVDNLKFQMLPRSIVNRILPPGGQKQERRVQAAPTRVEVPELDSSSSSTDSEDGIETPGSDDTLLEDDPESQGPSINLKAILYDETGVPENEIHHDSEIVDLGIDSLLALTINDRLRDEYQLDSLPSTLFQDYPTFGPLQVFIQSLLPKPKRHRENVITKKKAPKVKVQTTTKTDSAPKQVEKPVAKPAPDSQKKMDQVRGLIAEQMGVKPEEILPSDNLFDLGLDSLMSLEIVEGIRDVAGLDLESNFFMEANTLALIESTLFSSNDAVDVVIEEDSAPEAPETVEIRLDDEPEQTLEISQKTSILQGDPKRCTKKVFLFPDGSGAASVYARLPTVDEDTCVYGLNSPYLKKGVVANVSVKDFVGSWVQELKRLQPKGPYIMGGYSSGGYYAYEAAIRLMKEGERVDKLIFVDTPSRSVYAELPEDVLDVVSTSGIVGNDAKQLPTWVVDHFRTSVQALSRYTPTPIPKESQPKTYLIWASDGIADIRRTLAAKGKLDTGIAKFFVGKRELLRPHGWTDLISRENIHLAFASGHHFSIVHPPNVDRLRTLLATALSGKQEGFECLPGAGLDTAQPPKWQPECTSYTKEETVKYLSRKAPASQVSLRHQLDTLVLLYVRQVLDNFTEAESRKLPSHFQRFYKWAQYQAKQNDLSTLPDDDIETLESDLAGSGVDGALLSRIGHEILPIIRGKVQPLQLMLQGKLLFDYYPNNIHTAPCFPQVELLARRELAQGKKLNILEIGAGTGGTTKAMFRAIEQHEKSSGQEFGHYTYTDISAGFFKQAKDTFKPFVSKMTFKKLDVEDKPSNQGYEPGKYDLIIASQCLHATKNMTNTMNHVRELLSPGGKIIMVEGTRDALDVSFVFGTLAGWWFGEEENRQLTPCLDLPDWDECLRATGFNGADLVVPNCDKEEDHSLSVIVSTAV